MKRILALILLAGAAVTSSLSVQTNEEAALNSFKTLARQHFDS